MAEQENVPNTEDSRSNLHVRPKKGRYRCIRCGLPCTPTEMDRTLAWEVCEEATLVSDTWIFCMPKFRGGFGSIPAERLREISAKGGREAHKAGTAHEWDRKAAMDAGAKGGRAVKAKAAR